MSKVLQFALSKHTMGQSQVFMCVIKIFMSFYYVTVFRTFVYDVRVFFCYI